MFGSLGIGAFIRTQWEIKYNWYAGFVIVWVLGLPEVFNIMDLFGAHTVQGLKNESIVYGIESRVNH